MVAYLRGHKFTTLSNFISAIKKNFEYEGILPRGVLFRNVRNGLSQIFSTIDATVHKVALRRKDLLILIAYFIEHKLHEFAFAVAVNYWAALPISELLRLEWGDFKAARSFCVILVRIAKNHLRPKFSVVSHSSDIDSLSLLAAKHFSSTRQTKNIFSFSRSKYNKAIKTACRATNRPIGTSHSFRAGFITDAAALGIPDTIIAHHTRHSSTASLSDYKRLGVSDLQKLTASMATSE